MVMVVGRRRSHAHGVSPQNSRDQRPETRDPWLALIRFLVLPQYRNPSYQFVPVATVNGLDETNHGLSQTPSWWEKEALKQGREGNLLVCARGESDLPGTAGPASPVSR